MRNRIWKIFSLTVVAALALTAMSASAQPNLLRVTVPFQFVAGDTTLPSGEYAVAIDQNAGRIHFTGLDTASGAYLLRQSTHSIELDSTRNSLVFNKYGNTYFLSRIIGASFGQELEWAQSGAEKKLAMRTPVEVAFLPAR
jgi:hypothetical protein